MAEPRHFSIVVIDIESSGELDGPQKVKIREDLYRIVEAALEASGIAYDSEDRGDGIYLLVDSAVPIRRLIHPFIATVDAALADRRVSEPRLRIRMVVHQGAVSLDRQGSSGGAVDLAFAMVDAPQLRDALKQVKSGRIAIVVAEEVYRDVVRGHDEPDPTAFRVHFLETKRGPLRTFAAGVSRQFGIEDSGLAEEEMNRRLHKESGDIDYGLQLSLLAVNLHLDKDAQRHLADRVGSRRATERARDEHNLQVLREKHTLEQSVLKGDLERARAKHRRDVELAAARHSGELESVTSGHARELERIKSQHAADVERAEESKDLDLKKQRLKFYRRALEGNSSDVLVLQLIEHPDDITTVVNMLHHDTAISYDRARKVMTELLAKEMVHASDVEPLRQKVVDKLSSALNIAAPQGRVKIAHDRETTVGMDGDRVMASETESTTVTTD